MIEAILTKFTQGQSDVIPVADEPASLRAKAEKIAGLERQLADTLAEEQEAERDLASPVTVAEALEDKPVDRQFLKQERLPVLQERRARLVKQIKTEREELARDRQIWRVDEERRPGLIALLKKMFELAAPAEQAAQDVWRYLVETQRLGGTRSDVHPCYPLLRGFSAEKEALRKEGLLK